MGDFQPYAPLPEPPPARQSTAWLWILIGLAALLVCFVLIAGAVGLGGYRIISTQTARMAAATVAAPGPVITQEARLTQVSADPGQPPAGWTRVIDETFDSNANEWPTEAERDDSLSVQPSISKGRYIVRVDYQGPDRVISLQPIRLQGIQADQFYLAVSVRQSGGSYRDQDYGLVFGQKNLRNYSVFLINNAADASVSVYRDSVPADILPPTSEGVMHPSEQFNRLIVISDQDSYRFAINRQIVSIAPNPDVQKGTLGIFITGSASKAVTYEFDSFQLYVPPDTIP